MESLAAAVESLGIESAWLDGEAVVIGDDGLPSFNALQNAFDRVGTESIQLYFFDVPYLDGKDLRGVDLGTRRAVLRERLAGNTWNASASARSSARTAPACSPRPAGWGSKGSWRSVSTRATRRSGPRRG